MKDFWKMDSINQKKYKNYIIYKKWLKTYLLSYKQLKFILTDYRFIYIYKEIFSKNRSIWQLKN